MCQGYYMEYAKNKYFLKNPVSEAVARWCSVKKVFLEISQNLQENTCARASGTEK